MTEKLVDAISLEGPAVTLRSPLVRFSCENGFAARVRHLPDERGDGL